MDRKKEVTLFELKRRNINKIKKEPMVFMASRNKKQLVPASEVSRELIRVKGTWPFDFFPDEMIIEEKRIVIKQRVFPFYTSTVTIPFNKISSFEVVHSILFSSIYIKAFVGNNSDITFQWLSHEIAQKVKDIVDGLKFVGSEQIQILEKDKTAMNVTLEKLGHVY